MKDINFLKQNNVDVDKCLELFGDIETYNDTIKEFQSGLDEKLSQITKYYNDGDMPNYAIYVHSLKSDCKYFGFTTLANIAYEHEMKSKNNDFEYVKNNYARLMEEAEKVKNIVNEYLEDNTTIETLNEENETLTEDIILVADDSEVIRIFVKKIFDADYQLEFAKNGEEALKVIRDHEDDNRIKAILLDLNMPKVSGFSVLDYMTQSNLLEKMPVTIISGDSSSEAINRAFEYPIVDMINKPFSEAKIKDAVEKTIRQASNKS